MSNSTSASALSLRAMAQSTRGHGGRTRFAVKWWRASKYLGSRTSDGTFISWTSGMFCCGSRGLTMVTCTGSRGSIGDIGVLLDQEEDGDGAGKHLNAGRGGTGQVAQPRIRVGDSPLRKPFEGTVRKSCPLTRTLRAKPWGEPDWKP